MLRKKRGLIGLLCLSAVSRGWVGGCVGGCVGRRRMLCLVLGCSVEDGFGVASGACLAAASAQHVRAGLVHNFSAAPVPSAQALRPTTSFAFRSGAAQLDLTRFARAGLGQCSRLFGSAGEGKAWSDWPSLPERWEPGLGWWGRWRLGLGYEEGAGACRMRVLWCEVVGLVWCLAGG